MKIFLLESNCFMHIQLSYVVLPINTYIGLYASCMTFFPLPMAVVAISSSRAANSLLILLTLQAARSSAQWPWHTYQSQRAWFWSLFLAEQLWYLILALQIYWQFCKLFNVLLLESFLLFTNRNFY